MSKNVEGGPAPASIDLSPPQVQGMIKEAWGVVARAREKRLAREAQEREEGKGSAA